MSGVFYSRRQRASFEHAERERDKELMAGPPEEPSADVTVEYELHLHSDRPLSTLTEVLGGEAHWYASPSEVGWRAAKGSTLIEEAASYEEAEEIVQDLITEHLREYVDLDSIIATAERIEPDEPDWMAIAKDARVERELGR